MCVAEGAFNFKHCKIRFIHLTKNLNTLEDGKTKMQPVIIPQMLSDVYYFYFHVEII